MIRNRVRNRVESGSDDLHNVANVGHLGTHAGNVHVGHLYTCMCV